MGLVSSLVTIHQELVKIAGDFHDLIPSLSILDSLHERLFIGIEVDGEVGTSLEVNVQAVNEATRIRMLVTETEEVTLDDLGVTLTEVADESGELPLDQALDPSILDHVQQHLRGVPRFTLYRNTRHGAKSVEQGSLTSRSKESVAHFVTDEHIVHSVTHVFPHWKNQDSRLNIKTSRLSGCIMTDFDVFRREQTRKQVLRVEIHGL